MDNPSYYAIIPANVRYDKRLKANEKLLYGEITSLAQKNGICWATNEYFAELYDVRKEQISRWIANLVKFNYIKLKIIYKDDTKQIIGRYLSIITCESADNFIPPVAQKDNTYCVNTHDPHAEIINTPIAQKRKDNSTSTEQYKFNSTPLPPKGGLDENKKDKLITEEQINTKVTKPKPEFNYDGFNEIDKIAIKKWFVYRQEIKKPYKSQSGLTQLRNTLLELKLSNSVVESINRSLTAEYRGVYTLNSFKKKNNSQQKKTGMYIDDFTINKPLKQVDTL